jgi:hypothetical protein
MCDKELCYHCQILDSDVIVKRVAAEGMLNEKNEACRLTFVSEQIYGGNWDAYYAACDLYLVAFGASTGVASGTGIQYFWWLHFLEGVELI